MCNIHKYLIAFNSLSLSIAHRHTNNSNNHGNNKNQNALDYERFLHCECEWVTKSNVWHSFS